MDPLEFFATTVEELWYTPYPKRTAGQVQRRRGRTRPPTADGHLWVGHNNDLRPEVEADIVAIEKAVDDEPVVLQIGGVPWISVGWNQAGLSLTGNELSPNDERIGISRSHQVFEMLRARNLHEMVASAIRPDRASSYNNVLADRFGDVANVEGSATDVEITPPGRAGPPRAHEPLRERADAPVRGRPGLRRPLRRPVLPRPGPARGPPAGSVTPEALREILSDHENQPDEVCRHPEWGHPTSKTVFWCIADVTDGRISYGRGNPCDSMDAGVRVRRLRRRLKRRADPLDRGVVPALVREVGDAPPLVVLARRRPPRRRGGAPRSRDRRSSRRRAAASTPRTDARRGSRPASRRIRTTSDWRRLAAECSAVPVIHPRPNASTSAPRSSSSATASGSPKNAAKCRAVNPSPEYAVAATARRRGPPEPIHLAERRGLEHVERVRPGPHDLHEAGVEAVERTHQRRDAARVTCGRGGGIRVQDRLDPADVPRLDRGEEIVRGACHRPLPR